MAADDPAIHCTRASATTVLSWFTLNILTPKTRRFKVDNWNLTLKHLGCLFQNVMFLQVLFTANTIYLYTIAPIQLILDQHRGYWWPGALSTRASVATVMIMHPGVYRLSKHPIQVSTHNFTTFLYSFKPSASTWPSYHMTGKKLLK